MYVYSLTVYFNFLFLITRIQLCLLQLLTLNVPKCQDQQTLCLFLFILHVSSPQQKKVVNNYLTNKCIYGHQSADVVVAMHSGAWRPGLYWAVKCGGAGEISCRSPYQCNISETSVFHSKSLVHTTPCSFSFTKLLTKLVSVVLCVFYFIDKLR